MILGSKSPRRQELLKLIVDDFKVQTIEVDETVDDYISVKDYANQITSKKIKSYVEHFGKDEIIICADTIVALGDVILEKPKSKEHCYEMIKAFDGVVMKKHHPSLDEVAYAYTDSVLEEGISKALIKYGWIGE